jgi:hypothetical protein
MTVEPVRERYPESLEAVQAFFSQFYGADIEQTEDAQEEVVYFHVGKQKRVVAVHADFLADYGPTEIRENLAAWNVAHLSRTLERGCRLAITSDGPKEERDVR